MSCPICDPKVGNIVMFSLGCRVLKHYTDPKRLLIAPHQHVANLTELLQPTSGLLIVVANVARLCKLENYQLKMNQGSFQKEPHLHIHLISTSVIQNIQP